MRYGSLQHFRSLPDVLRRWRNEAGYQSQQQMAEKVGVSHQTWGQYESGNILVPLDRLDATMAALGKSMTDLVEDLAEADRRRKPSGDSERRALEAELRDLKDRIRQIEARLR
ncbi:MAG: helix-turn-helix transcriptional regulator [Acidobacteriota bacterium]